jgi:hypothetical protein
MLLLDLLNNLPRLWLSSSQLKMILWVMRECGAKDVPSYDTFHKKQKELRDACSIPVKREKSDLGNVFHTTNPADLIARVGVGLPTLRSSSLMGLAGFPESTSCTPYPALSTGHRRWPNFRVLAGSKWPLARN